MNGKNPEVENAIAQLFAQARVASEHAYSPYSGARVGACVSEADYRSWQINELLPDPFVLS